MCPVGMQEGLFRVIDTSSKSQLTAEFVYLVPWSWVTCLGVMGIRKNKHYSDYQ